MALARARALRAFTTAPRPRILPRVSRPRQQLLQKRFASGGGGHGAEASSDLPWMLGAVAVTIPSCWYLWPDSHAEHHGGHGEHGDHEEHEEHEEGGEGEEKAEAGEQEAESGEGEEKQEGGDEKSEESSGDDPKDDSSDSKAESSDDTDDSEGKVEQDDVTQESPGGVEERGSDAQDDEGGEQPTKPGGGGGKDDETKTEQVAGQRKIKKKPSSGQELGKGPEFVENSQADPNDPEAAKSKEAAATAKPTQDTDSGEISGKQKGLSTGPTKHSLPIDSDPSKSKKGEGTPETAKAQGTVDPNRPAR